MSAKQTSAYCNTCGQQRLFERQTPNHLLHLILSVVTLGLWLVVWAFVTLSNRTGSKLYRCTACGVPLGGGTTPQPDLVRS